jgi:hypothetical protein
MSKEMGRDRIDWEREYQNVPMPIVGAYCPHCEQIMPTDTETDWESQREPNKSHPEWFHIIDRGAYIDIRPKIEFYDLAVKTSFGKCRECRRTITIDGRPIYSPAQRQGGKEEN